MVIIFILVAAAFAIAVGLLLAANQAKPDKLLGKAVELRAAGKIQQARECFIKVAEAIDLGKASPGERDNLAIQTHMALAEIAREMGGIGEAVAHYRRAREFSAVIPPDALRLWAEYAAEHRENDQNDQEAYLAYLASGPSIGAAAERVYAVLHDLCTIGEEMKSQQRRPVVQLLRRVIEVKPGLEWAHYYLGLASLLDGRGAEALAEFGKAKELNRDRALTYYWLAVCHLQSPSRTLEPAVEMIERFLSFNSADPKTRARESKVCAEIAKRLLENASGIESPGAQVGGEKLEDARAAIHYLEIALARLPEDANCWSLLARARRLCGEHEKAIEALEKAIGADPARGQQYRLELAAIYRGAGRLADAVETLKKIVKDNPDQEDARRLLGETLFELGDNEAAIPYLSSVSPGDKRNARQFGMLVRALFAAGQSQRVRELILEHRAAPSRFAADRDAQCAAGRALIAAGNVSEAIAWLRASEGDDAIYYAGCAYALAEQYRAAVECFEQLMKREDGSRPRAQLQHGHVMWAMGRMDAAEADYRALLAHSPQNAEGLRALGNLDLGRGRPERAAESFRAALAVDAGDAEATFGLAISLERMGDVAAALRHYEETGEGERRATARLRAGILHCRQGNYSRALPCFGECASAGVDNDALLFYRGFAWAMVDRPAAALDDWEKLLKRFPGHAALRQQVAQARYSLGAQLLGSGRIDEAFAQWEEYLKVYAQDRDVHNDLAEMEFRAAMGALAKAAPESLAQARRHLSRGLEHDAKDRDLGFYLALCDVRTNERGSEAIAFLRGQMAGDAVNARLAYHLGWALLCKGNAVEARQWFEKLQQWQQADGYRSLASSALANLLIAEGNFDEASKILVALKRGPATAVEA